MKYKVDVVRIRENSITLNGWALGKTPESKVTFRVEDEHHQPVKCKMVSTRRDDVSQIYFKKVIDKEFGFDIQFPYERGKSYWLLIRCDGRQAKIKYNEELITKRASVAHKRMEKIKDLMNMETVHVALDFWKENGLKALLVKSKHKLQGIDNDYDYGEWYSLTKPTAEELEETGASALVAEPAELLPLFERGLLNVDALTRAFTSRGFAFSYFPTANEAARYIASACAGKSVSLGGSMTFQEMGFPEAFADSTEVHWHWITKGEYYQTPDIYLTSANALSESGEAVNIDGTCNRVAGTLYGPKQCMFVCGINKLCPDLASAVERARNVAAPKNAQRLGTRTPCAADGKCHDCKSPARICRALVVHMGAPKGFEKCEIVLVGESLGY